MTLDAHVCYKCKSRVVGYILRDLASVRREGDWLLRQNHQAWIFQYDFNWLLR